jgi:hypothetical protein
MNLTIVPKAEFDHERLYSQAASTYLDILDGDGRPPKVDYVVDVLCEKHPHYDAVQVATWLNDPEFDTYLKTRRQRHLIERTAAKLVAAEMGAALGVKAIGRLQDRLNDPGANIKDKDLIAMAQLGMTLNAGIDKDLTEATGDVKITMNLKNVLVGLPPERAAALGAAYARTLASPGAKAEVIDASSCTED